jgi:feruloyl esterase
MADYSRLPAFCRVAGAIKPTSDSDIKFELWLPEQNWNGKFMQTGNGVAAGSIVYSSLADPLARGYAVANTDTGHNGAGDDFSWALGHPEKLIDYQYRSIHELTIVGKAITEARYGKAPGRSYWLGCSTGGRQGLTEAQRFPDDYDAIVAGSPASNWAGLTASNILRQQNMGVGGLGADKVGLLHAAAIAACDAMDGVTDEVISEPGKCNFDPASLQCKKGQSDQCLSENEVAAAKRIYAGVVDKDGQVLYPGTGPGSEMLWAVDGSPRFRIGINYYRDVVMQDPNWDPATFNADTDLPRGVQATGPALMAMDPDLNPFIAHGGKLITYHGTADGLISYKNTVNYYESVVRKLGEDKVKDHVRFFLIPGMSHCSGGEGAYQIDWLSALENWDKDNQAPATLPAAHPAVTMGPPGAPPMPGKAFTRPACAWPEVAKYQGSGDDSDAANFECVMP